MKKIPIKLKKTLDESYDCLVGRGLLRHLPKHLRLLGRFSSYVIITDSQVKNLYGHELLNLLKKDAVRTFLLSFPAGEKSKNQKTKTFLETAMLKKHCGRDTLIIALGGGVVGDMAGFTAATYMRGAPYVQIPTTLLAMVDSSIGGKTGLDTPQGKNLIGAFWQPKKVFVDLDLIKNLPQRQILNGYYEVIKMGITSNRKLFEYAEKNLKGVRNRKLDVLEHLVTESLKIKARIVEKDEKEGDDPFGITQGRPERCRMGERMILNFGHTVGHALEQLSGFKLLHGQAVALGMMVEAKISALDGLLPIASFRRIERLLVKSGIDKSLLREWTASQIIIAAKSDKKTRGSRLRVVLIEGIGRLHRRAGLAASFVSDEMIKKALISITQSNH